MKKFIFLIFAFITLSIFAQSGIELNFTPVAGEYFNIFYPLYLNPDEPEKQPEIFSATLTNDTDETIFYYLKFWMSWRGNDLLPEGCKITPVNEELAPHPSVNSSVTITNRDIITNATGNFDVECEVDDILSNNTEFEDLLLQTGRFPDGEYLFKLQAFDSNTDEELTEAKTVTITVTTPSPISLITPGNPLGMEPSEIFDLYPNFVWYSNLAEYTIKIFELNEQTGNVQTDEDIENLAPYFERQVSTTSFTYPTDAPPLEDGNVYAWQVSANIVSPLNPKEEVYKSKVYSFKVSSGEETNPDDLLLINFLRQLNADNSEEVINLINNGFSVKNLRFKDSEISAEDLANILLRIANGEIRFKSLIIE